MHMGKRYSRQFEIEELFEEWEDLRTINDEIVEYNTGPLKAGSHIVTYDDSGAIKMRWD